MTDPSLIHYQIAMYRSLFVAISLIVSLNSAHAQEMQWEEYEPRSTLVVDENPVTSARFPFVDAHGHQWGIGTRSEGEIDALVAEMDALNMAVMVNLSGGNGETLRQNVETTDAYAPGRFVHFANVDFSAVDDPDFGKRAAAQLREDVRNGARGLKIFKNLGMSVFYADGSRVRTDDPRLNPIWETAGDLGIPVLIHTGDPAPFWEPHDRYNERWFELKERPRRKRPAEPSWETIMGEHWNLIRNHPNTTFISAHLSWLGNDLGRLGELLDELPNMYTELGAVLAELGRQPRTARQFLIDYQDRVLMGKDSWAPSEYHVYFRTFETADEYFPYYRTRHAFWRMYGLDLPDEVLRKVYADNARAIIPGLDASLFSQARRPHLESHGGAGGSQHGLTGVSQYAGQEQREIKTLSGQDVDDLLKGRGWGFAKAAELNGVPGPLHLLEMKEAIGLTPEQVERIQSARSEMTAKAVPLGERFVSLERDLNERFARRSINGETLESLLDQIAAVQSDLRLAHLEAHLTTLEVLTEEQIRTYNELRGY